MRRKTIGTLSFIMALVLLVSAGGCGGQGGKAKYKVIEGRLMEEEFALGFRSEDKLHDITDAALKVLAARGTLSALSHKWFGEDVILIQGDEDALEELAAELPRRTFIMGISEGAAPMSFKDDDGEYAGFDIDLAKEICGLLGWELQFQPIKPLDVAVELSSGNVDCAGGMSFGAYADRLSVSDPYMKNRKALVVLSESGLSSKSKLGGKTLGMSFSPSSEAALKADEKLSQSLGPIKKMDSTTQCFRALEAGACDVILVDSVAVDYFMSRP